MADATFQPKSYKTNGGDKQVIASGGVVDFESGAALKIGGTDITAFLAAIAALGYVVKVGTGTLDGSGATPVASGLTAVAGGLAVLKKSTAPGVGTSVLTVNPNGAALDVYPWKVTGAGDATLIASTGTEDFFYVLWGT